MEITIERYSDEIKDEKKTVETPTFTFKYKESQRKDLLEALVGLDTVSADKIIQAFIYPKMKKCKNILMKAGEFDTYYEIFKNELKL